MPDRGDERGRGGTRTLVTGILAGTEWHPATNPQEATQTARDARDLAVRLRPVLSKLAQAPRGGRRRDLEWLPAVEQLAVDAQYFASWWLPRLEGKSAQSWPSWSADGYADWVKRLDAQRLRTLEMIDGTAPVTRIASVTQLRRGKGTAAGAEDAVEAAGAVGAVGAAGAVRCGRCGRDSRSAVRSRRWNRCGGSGDPGSQYRRTRRAPVLPRTPCPRARRGSQSGEEERTARITPLRGPGAALMDAALMDMASAPDAPGMRAETSEPGLSADETHIAKATPASAPNAEKKSGIADTPGIAESPAPPTPEPNRHRQAGTEDSPNQGPVTREPDTTRVRRPPADREPYGFDGIASEASEAAVPRVPRTPPNQGPAEAKPDADSGVGADILQIPRTPPNSGPADADGGRAQPACAGRQPGRRRRQSARAPDAAERRSCGRQDAPTRRTSDAGDGCARRSLARPSIPVKLPSRPGERLRRIRRRTGSARPCLRPDPPATSPPSVLRLARRSDRPVRLRAPAPAACFGLPRAGA